MNKLIQSRTAAWSALVLVITLIIVTFGIRSAWWSFFDLFFIFMMAFSHLAALYLRRFSASASATLERIAMVCGVLTVVAFIAEYLAFLFV